MSLLVRKINRAKWQGGDIAKVEEVAADAITVCLKTSCNTLSLWMVDNEDGLDEAIIAIASNCDKVEAMDFVWLNPNYFQEKSIEINNTKGKTALKEMEEKHRDLCNLTYSRLGLVAYHVIERIREGKSKRVSKLQLKELLLNAIKSGRIRHEDLNSNLLTSLDLNSG